MDRRELGAGTRLVRAARSLPSGRGEPVVPALVQSVAFQRSAEERLYDSLLAAGDSQTRSGDGAAARHSYAQAFDVAAVRQVERMRPGDVVTAADLESALKAQRTEVREGDVVLIRTGHGQLWMKDNKTFSEGEPGLGMEAARWLTDRKIVMVGTDTWATEVVPHEDKDRPYTQGPAKLTSSLSDNNQTRTWKIDRIGPRETKRR